MRTKPSFALVWWLSLAQLITWGSSFYGFALFMGPMEQHLHLTRSESSLAFSLALLCEGLMAFVVGRWIDKGYAKQVMTWGSVCVGLAFLVHRWVDSSFAFYALWMLIGAGWSATLYNPAFTVLTQHYPHDFRRAIITMTFLGGLARRNSSSPAFRFAGFRRKAFATTSSASCPTSRLARRFAPSPARPR
jgi:MFS family permease